MNNSEPLTWINGSDDKTYVICDTNLTLTFVIVTITTSIIIGAIIFGNTLVILSIHRFDALKTVNNYFICSLACADLIAVGMAIQNAGLTLGTMPFHGSIFYCMLHALAFQEGCQVSVLHLFVIAIDRHLAISSPLAYHVRMTPKRAKCTILTMWAIPNIYMTFLFVFTLVNSNADLQDMPCNLDGILPLYFSVLWQVLFFGVPFIIMFVLYLHIFWIARKQSRQIAVQEQALETTTFKKSLKATKTVAIVIGAFVICWLPFITWTNFIEIASPKCWTIRFLYFLSLLVVSNSALNPAIYAWRNREFRESFTKLLRRQ
ncbi:trace amine-associated receptor 5-like [Glandiceps talaboti]